MALVPWPDPGTDRDSALISLKALLGRDPSNGARLSLMASVVSARIQKTAPGAPADLKDESLVRGVAFLLDIGSGAHTRQSIGEETLTLSAPAFWFVRSGAASILKCYTIRRAGKV